MRKILSTLMFCITLALQVTAQQPKTGNPLSFDKFFKEKMKVVAGTFPVYQLDDKYYLQIGSKQLNKDLLVVGDIRYGSSTISKSSGVLRFTKGGDENLYVIKSNYSEQAIDNDAMATLLSGSTLAPINYTFRIEALGKDTGSYIIDITKQLIDGGELFSFKNYNLIANPDASRSGVDGVMAINNGVAFNVYRSQNNPGRDYNGKPIDQAITVQLALVLQQLADVPMPIKIADRRIGFDTRSFTDFGIAGYAAKKVNMIKKWNIQVKPEDVAKYQAGVLVSPQRPIVVYLHSSIPKFLQAAVKDGILAWNKCFETAGFKNVIRVVLPENGGQVLMEEGSVVVAWGGVAPLAAVEMVDDPRTGEIKTAKITFSDTVIDNLLQKYFIQCGLQDVRIQKDAYAPAVRQDILKFKATQAMALVLGMLPNYAASAAFTPQQVSDPNWVAKNGFTASVTDDLEFNYLMPPTKTFNGNLLIPGIGAYDHFAINWAYRQFQEGKNQPSFLTSGKINPLYYYSAEDKSSPLALAKDLSSQNIEAAQLGIDKLVAFYPKLNGIAAKMKDDTWDTYMLLAANFIMSYDQYVTSVLPNIGGKQRYTVMKGYNSVPFVYTPKARQQATFIFLYNNVLKGVPSWTRNDRAQAIDGSNTETLVTKTAVRVVNYLVSADLIQNLIDAEKSGQKDVFGTEDLFTAINRYVFLDFDKNKALNSYQRNIQATAVRGLISLAAKNKLGSGLSEISVVLNGYTSSLADHIAKMAKEHADLLTREHFQLMKMMMNNELNAK
ncbi:hypothetical protein HDC90_002570 [Pedobacter sp. AK013]|uniref:DUF5117 and DUF5118 domain-containing protein n=1 Tax=Pedobacter sp. AK013 TaxID=2723071 RepID=UPI0016231450|nr:zinc-dependent metalloprotease [Pedobacter sp. AK013]MBB6237944.1 hypothetical protein [Pedobacter sp. AK013]